MKRHDDDGDEIVGDRKRTAGNVCVVGGRCAFLEYGMAVGSSKISCGSWILFLNSLFLYAR